MIHGDETAVPFKDWAFEEWRTKYGVKPPWGKREYTNLAAARSRFDTEELARAAWSTYLKNSEPFYEGHGPGKFLYDLGKWTAKVPKRPQKQVEGEAVVRAQRMAKIYAEVERDASIPEAEKKNEASRRWKELG